MFQDNNLLPAAMVSFAASPDGADPFAGYNFGGYAAAPARPQAAQLANRGATVPTKAKPKLEAEVRLTEDLRNSTSARWRLKTAVAKILKESPRAAEGRSYAVCGCGYAAKFKDADGDLQTVPTVKIMRRDQTSKPYVSGSLRCNSPWVCPTCGPKKAMERQLKLKEVIERTDALGGTCAFVTLTISHDLSQSLEEVRELFKASDGKARKGNGWIKIQDSVGVLGVVNNVEVLRSKTTGWHYHAHLLIPCRSGDHDAVKEAMEKLVERFMEQVTKRGGKVDRQAQDVKIVDTSDRSIDQVAYYASKGSAAWELAGGLKDARARASMNPWDLAQLANAGDEEAKALFIEYALVMVGKRSGLVSPTLAKALGMEPSKDNDDKAEVVEEEDDDHEVSVELVSDKWRKIMSYGVAWKVLEAAETGDEPEVEGVIFDLLEEIEEREYQQQITNMQAFKDAKIARITAGAVAQGILHHRRLGESFERAKKLAIADIKLEQKFYGKSEFVWPSDAEIGRAVSAIASVEWQSR